MDSQDMHPSCDKGHKGLMPFVSEILGMGHGARKFALIPYTVGLLAAHTRVDSHTMEMVCA